MFANLALDKLLRDHEFSTVLDVGCGSGEHAAKLEKAGKVVTRNPMPPIGPRCATKLEAQQQAEQHQADRQGRAA